MTTQLLTPAVEIIKTPAIATLAAAFAADPAVRWMYPDAPQYQQYFPGFVQGFCGKAFLCRTVDISDDASGVALWLPPGVQPDEEELNALFEASVPTARRDHLHFIFEQMASFHPEQPHWYLPLIGVDPAHQGRGIGGALLARGLQRCDSDGLPAYLESSNPRNIALYRRHGFEVMGRIQAGDSPEITPMLRQPR